MIHNLNAVNELNYYMYYTTVSLITAQVVH